MVCFYTTMFLCVMFPLYGIKNKTHFFCVPLLHRYSLVIRVFNYPQAYIKGVVHIKAKKPECHYFLMVFLKGAFFYRFFHYYGYNYYIALLMSGKIIFFSIIYLFVVFRICRLHRVPNNSQMFTPKFLSHSRPVWLCVIRLGLLKSICSSIPQLSTHLQDKQDFQGKNICYGLFLIGWVGTMFDEVTLIQGCGYLDRRTFCPLE